MTKTEFTEYEKRVNTFIRDNRVKLGCYSPTGSEFFSNKRCECCLRNYAGDREEYSFACENGEQFTADICADCVYYLAYGRLDDLTMLEIAENEKQEGRKREKAREEKECAKNARREELLSELSALDKSE